MTDLEQLTPPNASRKDFLAARQQGLGSSDVAALIGADPYRTSLTVYLDKTAEGEHRVDGDDEEEADTAADARYWGTVLEAPVADHFARVNNVVLIPAGTYARNGWQLASPDRLIASFAPDEDIELPAPGEPYFVGGYEGKTASAYLEKEWRDGQVPDRYIVQTYWQMHVLGLPYVWIAALIGGQQYVQVRVDRDQEFIDGLVTIAARFWQDHVLPQIPPPLFGQPVQAALDLIKELHPVSVDGSRLELSGADADTMRAWVQAREYHKAWARTHSKAADGYEVLIRERLGDYEQAVAVEPDGGRRKLVKATNIAGCHVEFDRKPSRRLYPAPDLKASAPEVETPTQKEITQ